MLSEQVHSRLQKKTKETIIIKTNITNTTTTKMIFKKEIYKNINKRKYKRTETKYV